MQEKYKIVKTKTDDYYIWSKSSRRYRDKEKGRAGKIVYLTSKIEAKALCDKLNKGE